MEGYKVVGAFNPGAITYGDKIILLLRVAEKCEPKQGYVSTPIYKFEKGESYPAIMEFKEDDPDVKLKDTRGVIYIRSRLPFDNEPYQTLKKQGWC